MRRRGIPPPCESEGGGYGGRYRASPAAKGPEDALGARPQPVIGVGPGVVANSASSTTSADNMPAIDADSANGFVQVTSGYASTTGNNAEGIYANAETDIEINSTRS